MKQSMYPIGEPSRPVSCRSFDVQSWHPASRIQAIDFVRGIAIVLMIISHGIKGLLTFEQVPSWGLVPIHLLTKFSSSLFILVFGISLSLAFVPYVGTDVWPEKRLKLLLRGVVVFFWYKLLTIVEMVHQYTADQIIDTLLYRAFPVYVEILGFYALALIWVPFVLPLWKKTPTCLKIAFPVLFGVSAWGLHQWDFLGLESLKAVLVEDKRHYTWGQFTRGPIVFVGLLIGDAILLHYHNLKSRITLAGVLALMSGVLLLLFAWNVSPDIHSSLVAIAKNEGKHPPDAPFLLFSLGGSFLMLSIAIAGGKKLAAFLSPITAIGKNSLQAFVFHIFVIFVFYRYLFNYWHRISYAYALGLTLLLIILTALWVKVTPWIRSKS